jgi:hypothetical protein
LPHIFPYGQGENSLPVLLWSSFSVYLLHLL